MTHTKTAKEITDEYLTKFVERIILDGAAEGWSPDVITEIGSRMNVNREYLLFRMNKLIADSSSGIRYCPMCFQRLEEGESHIRTNDDETCDSSFDD